MVGCVETRSANLYTLSHGEVTQIAHSCLALVTEMLDKRVVPGPTRFDTIRDTATQWARAGVPSSAILRACCQGVRTAFGLVATSAEAGDMDEVWIVGDLMLEPLNAISTHAIDTYTTEHLLVAQEFHSAQTLAAALISGRGGSALVRQVGVLIADSYQVVALSIPDHPDEYIADPSIAAQRKLGRLHAEVGRVFDSRTLGLLGVGGGTLVIACGATSKSPYAQQHWIDSAEAAGVQFTAAVVVKRAGPDTRIGRPGPRTACFRRGRWACSWCVLLTRSRHRIPDHARRFGHAPDREHAGSARGPPRTPRYRMCVPGQ